MIPTFVTGFYGMNISLPFMGHPFAWIGILSFCGLSALIGGWTLSDRRNARLVQRSVLGARESGREVRRKKKKKRSLPD